MAAAVALLRHGRRARPCGRVRSRSSRAAARGERTRVFPDRLAVAAEHVRHFQLGALHRPRLRRTEARRESMQAGGAGASRAGWWSSTPWWWRSQIARRRRQAAMAEQQLNRADVGARFQQMDGERMAQGMRRDGLGNGQRRWASCTPARSTAARVMGWSGRSPGKSQCWGLATRHQCAESPAAWARASRSDPSAPCPARRGGPSADCRSRGFEADGFGDPQAGGVAGRQDRAMLEAGLRREKLHHLFGAEHDRQGLRLLGRRDDVVEAPILLQRDSVEKAQRGDGDEDRPGRQLASRSSNRPGRRESPRGPGFG